MQAILLAAGNSSRFVPFTGIGHKSLVKLLGKTLLEHTILSLKNVEIRDIVIVVGKDSPIPAIIGDGKKLGITITYVVLPEALGMGAAILQAKQYLQEKFFVLSAYHMDIDLFAREMQSLQAGDGTVVLLGKQPDGTGYGFFQHEKNIVTQVVEKPTEPLRNALQIVGIYLLNKSFLATLEKTPLDHYHFETALHAYTQTKKITFVLAQKPTVTLKYAWDLFAIKDYLLSKVQQAFVSPNAVVSPQAIIKGTVYIEEGATVLEGACIKGPAYIGKQAFVGNNSVVRNGTIVEEGAVVGSFLELKNTILLDHATTHTGLIEDSIIGRKCKIAAGILTANVRLDRGKIPSIVKDEKINTGLTSLGCILGDSVRLGARVTTMPGVIVGEKSIIGPSTTVMKNVAPQTKYYTKFSEIVEEANENEK